MCESHLVSAQLSRPVLAEACCCCCFMYVCMSAYGYVHSECRCWIPRNWSSRQLSTVLHGCWERGLQFSARTANAANPEPSLQPLFVAIFVLFSETKSYYVAQAGFRLVAILWSQPPKAMTGVRRYAGLTRGFCKDSLVLLIRHLNTPPLHPFCTGSCGYSLLPGACLLLAFPQIYREYRDVFLSAGSCRRQQWLGWPAPGLSFLRLQLRSQATPKSPGGSPKTRRHRRGGEWEVGGHDRAGRHRQSLG